MYSFEIDLVSENPDLDLDKIMASEAALTLEGKAGDIRLHGVPSKFEQRHGLNNYYFYHAVLVPKLWWLTQTRHNQVFLDKSAPDLIRKILDDGGLTGRGL